MWKDLTKAVLLLASQVNGLVEQRKIEFDWLKSHAGLATKQDLKEMEKRIVMTQKELSDALDRMTVQTGKVAKEQNDRFDALTATIKELTDAINAGEVKPEVATALTNAQAALDSLDAAIPDAP